MIEDEPYQRLTVLMKEERLFTRGDIKRRDIAMMIGISDRALHDCVPTIAFFDSVKNLTE